MANVWDVLGGDQGLFVWIGITVIALFLIYSTVRAYKITVIHRERMAMIERGIDPGAFVEDGTELLHDEEEEDKEEEEPDKEGQQRVAGGGA